MEKVQHDRIVDCGELRETLTEIDFVFSWFHNGGSPHGLDPSPGRWRTLGPIFRATLLASVVLAIFGNLEKGSHEYTS